MPTRAVLYGEAHLPLLILTSSGIPIGHPSLSTPITCKGGFVYQEGVAHPVEGAGIQPEPWEGHTVVEEGKCFLLWRK